LEYQMVEAVDRTVALIEQLAYHPEGVGLLRLAELVGLAPSTTHRYLATLCGHGVVEQDDQRQYRLTSRLYLLGLAAGAGFDLEAQSGPSLKRLAERSQETACLMVRDGEHSVCIGQVDSNHQLKIAARVGSRQDLRLGATSRVLLAFAPESLRDELLRREPASARTRNTITDPVSIGTLLKEIRELGYYVSRGEVDDGVLAVAAPVRDRSGEVTAALAVVAPETRMGTGSALDHAITLITEEARELSLKLGYSAVTPSPSERITT
jgi:DNA-binding IclR family transcriptional regulator